MPKFDSLFSFPSMHDYIGFDLILMESYPHIKVISTTFGH
jgi:hypothetical protein